jgi:hypothetical protein
VADELNKTPPYTTLIVISVILAVGLIILAVLGGGPWVFFLGLLFAILAFIFWGKLPRREGEPTKSATGLRMIGAGLAVLVGLVAVADALLDFVGLGLALDVAVFAFALLVAWFLFPGLRQKVPQTLSLVIGILLALITLVGVLGYLMPLSFIYVALFFAGCAVIAVVANLVYYLMAKSETAATVGGWIMAVVMAGIFVFIFVGGEIVQLAINLEVERRLEPKILPVAGAAEETTAVDLKSFAADEVVLRPGDTDAAVADASGLEVGHEVLIGSVTDSTGNVYPSPHAERVTVVAVDTAAKTFSWDPDQPLENYHLTGEYVIKSRTNIIGILGIIVTLLVIFAGKVRLPEMIRNAFGWFLGFAFLLTFVYLAVTFFIDGSRYAIILGVGALLAPGIAVFAWLRDRAAARKLNL